MAVLKDLIVHGRSRFINGIDADSIHANLIDANDGVFKTITTTTLDAETITTDMLKANNARVSQTLTVDGTISTNKWEAENIANIGGNFYISPTGKANSGTITVTKTSTTTVNGISVGVYTLVVSGTFGVTSTSSTIWGTSSKVIFTGSISYPKITGTDLSTTGKKYPLGTCNGTMTQVSTGTGTLTGFTITGINSPALDIFFKEIGKTTISSIACSGYEMQISVYQSYYSSALHPIGILLTSYGKEKQQYIDIYNGENTLGDSASGFANPGVRIGLLDGLADIRDGVTDSSSPTKPTGWGIYTTNGFFKGKVVANAGLIGGWNIGTDTNKSLYTNTFNTSGGIYISPSYSGVLAIAGNTSKNWAFAAGANFGVTTDGKLYASGAEISGNIAATQGFTVTSSIGGDVIASLTGNGITLGNEDSTANVFNIKITNTAINNHGPGILLRKGNMVLNEITESGMEIFSENDSHLIRIANFSADGAQIGKTSGAHTTIGADGMQVYSVKSNQQLIELANIGYGQGQGESGTATAPYYSIGIRKDSSTIGNYSLAEGIHTTASGFSSHAEGATTYATGSTSHAEGARTTASGQNSHAEGANTTASGQNSHAEGLYATASGQNSHAEGLYATASEFSSHAQNWGTVASKENQTAIGRWNIEDTETIEGNQKAFIIGNGTGDLARSDAFTVDWGGNVVASGNVTDGSGNVLANKKVDFSKADQTDGGYTVTVASLAGSTYLGQAIELGNVVANKYPLFNGFDILGSGTARIHTLGHYVYKSNNKWYAFVKMRNDNTSAITNFTVTAYIAWITV